MCSVRHKSRILCHGVLIFRLMMSSFLHCQQRAGVKLQNLPLFAPVRTYSRQPWKI